LAFVYIDFIKQTMTVMTRSMKSSQHIKNTDTSETSQQSYKPTIKQLKAFNHCKRWQDNDDNKLKDINKKSVITPNNIQEIANDIGRTYGSIKSRILSMYIKNIFDYKTGNNDNLLDKYKFATMEDIEYYALKGFSIKEKLEYKLRKISNINYKMNDKNNCDKVLKIIDSIREENNLLHI